MKTSEAQQRLLDIIEHRADSGGLVEYWPIVNDWVKDSGRAQALAMTNINRTTNALIKKGLVEITPDGEFHILRPAVRKPTA